MKSSLFLSKNLKETKRLARALGAKLRGGEVIALVGDLGAGKTIFVQGLAKGLGIKALPKSPTFILIKEYSEPKKLKLYHLDCYRLKKPKEFLGLGLKEMMKNKKSVMAVEWAEKIKNLLPKDAIWVEIESVKKQTRKIKIVNPNA